MSHFSCFSSLFGNATSCWNNLSAPSSNTSPMSHTCFGSYPASCPSTELSCGDPNRKPIVLIENSWKCTCIIYISPLLSWMGYFGSRSRKGSLAFGTMWPGCKDHVASCYCYHEFEPLQLRSPAIQGLIPKLYRTLTKKRLARLGLNSKGIVKRKKTPDGRTTVWATENVLCARAFVWCVAALIMCACALPRTGDKLLKQTQTYPHRFCVRVARLHLRYVASHLKLCGTHTPKIVNPARIALNPIKPKTKIEL